MRTLKTSIAFIFILVALFNLRIGVSGSNSIARDINQAVKTGDYNTISSFIDGNIQMSFDAQNYIYSKQQAKQILKRFFELHKPKFYNIVEEGGTSKSKFSIGELKTANGNYNLYFYYILTNQKSSIVQLRIDPIE